MATNNEIRAEALTQLKLAQHMIEEGRKELAAALDKISVAQELIDQSAETLRETPPHHAEHVIGAAMKPTSPAPSSGKSAVGTLAENAEFS